MPRRLIAFVVALVLACSGFSAVARVLLPAFGDEHAASPLHYATPAERPDPAMPAPFLEGPLRPPRG